MKTAAPMRSGLPPLRMAMAPQIGVSQMADQMDDVLDDQQMHNRAPEAEARLRYVP